MTLVQRIQRKRRRRLVRLCILLGLIVIIFFGAFHVFPHQEKLLTETVLDVAAQNDTITPTPTPFSQTSSQPLGNTIQNALVGTHGTYGIVVENLKTHENYYQNPEKVYLSGSLYKLWVMATVYEQIKKEKLHLNDKLSKPVVDLNREFAIDPANAEETSGTITYTLQDALYQMITISDNYAALLLADKVGLVNIADFLLKNGFTQSKVGMHGKSPVTTPYEITLFFQKLYDGQLVDKNSSDAMLTLLKQQRLNDKIPEYLPVNTVVSHKTGELDNVTHDAGIVYAPNGDYIIVVLSLIDDRELANERIANVSKAVYEYFDGQTTQSPE